MNNKKSTLIFLFSFFLFLFFVVPQSFAQQGQRYGILGQLAPSWEVDEWMQLPKEKKTLDIQDFKGKVLYLYAFQAWCPGCLKHGFPTLYALSQHYKDDPNVAFVGIQTTFEGHNYNTFSKIPGLIERFHLQGIPMGQSGSRWQGSSVMKNYRTGGTPWTIIIDKQGRVRFNHFHIEKDQAIQGIDILKKL